MNGVLSHCAYIGWTGPGEPSQDGEMNGMALPSRHRITIRNSRPGGLRPSTLPLCHGGSSQYVIFTTERGRNTLLLWNLKARVGFHSAISDFSSRQFLATAPGPPSFTKSEILSNTNYILPSLCIESCRFRKESRWLTHKITI